MYQDVKGDLIASLLSDTNIQTSYSITAKFPAGSKARNGTALAVVSDAAGFGHVYYIDVDGDLRHAWESGADTWNPGTIGAGDDGPASLDGGRIAAAEFLIADTSTYAQAVLYQAPNAYVQLALSGDPTNSSSWRIIDVLSYIGNPTLLTDKGGMSLGLVSGWQPQTTLAGSEANPSGLIFLAQDSAGWICGWECQIGFKQDDSAPSFICTWLNSTFSGDYQLLSLAQHVFV